MPTVIFEGDGDFDDRYEPVSGKSEWGMDTLTRGMSGKQTELVSFIQGLAQGSSYSWNGQSYKLQSWECDNNPVFPTVTLFYKGLNDGIPDPFVIGRTMEQTSSATTEFPVSITFFDYEEQTNVTKEVIGTRTTRYLTRESIYRYIKASRPTSPTYTALDVSMTPIVLSSVIATDAGKSYYSNAPAALATALTPAIYNEVITNCVPVFGTPYFECEDIVTQYYN